MHAPLTKRLTWGTSLIASTHVVMAILHVLHLAAPTRLPGHDIPPSVRLVALIADDIWWAPCHVAIAAFVVAAWHRRCWKSSVVACHLSFAAMTWWGALCLTWAASTNPPSSLVGGVLAIAVGLWAAVLAQSWAVLGVDD